MADKNDKGPEPAPKANEVLIRILATAVAAEDPGMRRAPGLNGFRSNPTTLRQAGIHWGHQADLV